MEVYGYNRHGIRELEDKMKNKAFTLAEVLITLGIIGVVASMTLPDIIQSNKNTEVEGKLKKVYSVMNQAILMSEIDNGPKEHWNFSDAKFFDKYFAPYLTEVTVKEFQSFGGKNIAAYFSDGSLLVSKNSYDYFFFPNAKNFDQDSFSTTSENGSLEGRNDCGVTYFAFQFSTALEDTDHKYHYKKGFEPYKAELSELSKEELMHSGHVYSCNKNSSIKVWCTALIQLNGWKIPKDYPFKVK